MMTRTRRFLLDEPAAVHGMMRFVCGLDAIKSGERKRSTVTLTRLGRSTDPRFHSTDDGEYVPQLRRRDV